MGRRCRLIGSGRDKGGKVTTTIDSSQVIASFLLGICHVTSITNLRSVSILCLINMHRSITLWCTIDIVTPEDTATYDTALSGIGNRIGFTIPFAHQSPGTICLLIL